MAVYKRFTREKVGKPKTRLDRSEEQALWETRIFEAEAVKEDWKDFFACDALESVYYGHQKPDTWSDPDWFTINLTFASVKIMMRNICPRVLDAKMKLTRTFIADPESIMQLEQLVRVRQAVLQYFVTNLKLWKEGRQAYLNSLWQFGCVKVGYSAEMEDNPNSGGIVMDESGAPVYDEQGMPVKEPKKSVKTEEFFIDLIDPDCVIVDKYCQNDPDKTGRFIAHKIYSTVEDLQNDPFYPKSRTENLGPSALYEAERKRVKEGGKFIARWQYEAGVTLPENEIVVLYEIYDLKYRQTLTIARGASDIIKDPHPIPDGVDGHPFVFLKFYEMRDAFYPIPAIFNWMGPQLEYNITRNQIAMHRKRFNRKYLYDENKIDVEEVEKLQIGDDGTFAKVRASGAVEPVKDASLDQAVYFETKQYQEEFMELSGVGQLQRAMVGAESATEAEIVERRAREGEVDEHAAIMDFYSEVCKKLHNSMEANLTQEGAVEFVGPAGAQWMSFGPEHFDKVSGEILFTVTAEEALRMTVQVERAQMLQLLDVLGKNPMMALDDVLLRALFDKFPAFAGNELLIQSVKKLAMLQVQMQMAQVAEQKAAKQVTSSSTGGEAGKSRKVATGK